MRSPSAVAGALILLLGVPIAFVAASAFENAAEIVIHFALGASFALFARSVVDFETPRWVSVPSVAATGVLAAIFLLQGVADVLRSDQLRHLAYDVLGQRLEKTLGYAFVFWCVVLLAMGEKGKGKLLGAVVLAVIICVEIYSFVITIGGAHQPDALKLLYLPLFVWLLAAGAKPRRPAAHQLDQD